MGRHGLNINAFGMSDQQVLGLTNPNVSTHLIFNNAGLAQQVHDKVGGTVISRADYPDDSIAFPANLIGKWQNEGAPDAYHYWPNEPHPPSLAQYLAASDTFLDQVGNVPGLKVCIGNFAFPSILQSADVANGVWDPFLKTTSALSQEGRCVIGSHEYTEGMLPYGCAGRDPNVMAADIDLSDISKWPTRDEIYHDQTSDWHLFRWMPLWGRCVDLGIPMPKMVVTECFWDADDGEGGLHDLYAKLEGWLGGAKLRGIINQRDLFKHWFPDTPNLELDAAIAQLKWCSETYPDFVLGFCHFTASTDPKWALYNMLAWPELLEALPNV